MYMYKHLSSACCTPLSIYYMRCGETDANYYGLPIRNTAWCLLLLRCPHQVMRCSQIAAVKCAEMTEIIKSALAGAQPGAKSGSYMCLEWYY